MGLKGRQNGSAAHIIIITVLVLALIGALGYIFWKNFINKGDTFLAQTSTEVSNEDNMVKCETGEDTKATSGVFCSDSYGLKFEVPSKFEGKLQVADNEPIYAVSDVRDEIGTTDTVYSAKVTEGQYEYSLTVLLLPQINGMSLDLAGDGKFNSADKKIYSIYTKPNDPVFYVGDEYKSVTSDKGIKFYHESFGDAGTVLYTDVAVINEKVVKIVLRANPLVDVIELNGAASIDDEVILKTAVALD